MSFVIINPSGQFPLSELENVSLSALLEKFCNELITYRANLVTGVDYTEEYKKEINGRATKEYEERIKPIKKELNKREQLYLMYDASFTG